jgi:hypothetical protein
MAKVFALLHTRFREVLLLDADSLPLTDPALLFRLPQYQQVRGFESKCIT